MPQHHQQIERIKHKLERAARMPRKSQKEYLDQDDIANYQLFFGADVHRFQLNPPMTHSSLEVWEATYDIRLPSTYRAFLEHVGNGGAGPYYGIVPLALPSSLNAAQRDAYKEHLHQPCLLVDRPYHLDEDPETWLIEVAGTDWEKKEEEGWTPDTGTVEICDHGCAMYDYLVVNGPLHGRVVFRQELYPPFVYPGSFLDWYEAWLDRVLEAEHPRVS